MNEVFSKFKRQNKERDMNTALSFFNGDLVTMTRMMMMTRL